MAQFVRHSGGKLYEGDQEFRFVSWNVPNLLIVEDAFEFLGDAPWRWPDEFEQTDALESVKQMGGSVVRPYVISVHRQGSDMGDHVHVRAPGEFNEEAFRVLDRALAIARAKGVRIIIPLVDNWRWHGGAEQYAAFRGKPAAEFWTDEQLINDFLRTVEFVVNRRNTVTGIAYRDDPTILGWETGNELDCPPEWTRRVAAYIKSLDKNHLVIDGRSLKGVTPESLVDPNIDVVTTHHYPNLGNTAEDVLAAIREVDDKKAYFVGEFGFVDVAEAQRIFDAVIDNGASGALYWSLRFHRREGGFYWHHEPSGGDLFKAYHWPGFPSGREYREHLVLPMVRNAAFRIQGREAPAPPTPDPPVLLPIEHPSRISWQGAAGASAYDVQRAPSDQGPWETVGADISDAAVQYRPLFADPTAEAGENYWYRVFAKNSSGSSSPSNFVEASPTTFRVVVDEFEDSSHLDKIEGTHEFRSNAARTVQEDIHRLLLAPSGSVEYRSEDLLQRVTLWVFAKDPAASLRATAYRESEAEGVAVRLNSQPGSENAGDYGYLLPIKIVSEQLPPGVRRLKLTVTGDELQLSRAELQLTPPAAK